MKIAFLSSIYLKNCESIYKKRKGLIKKSYNEQQLVIEEETICSIGQWRHYLLDKGFESIMLCRNNFYIQNTWCRENKFNPYSDDKEFDTIEEQVRRFKPDCIFVFGASYYSKNNRIERLVKCSSNENRLVCWYGAPEGDEGIFMQYDLVLTNSLTLRDSIRERGVKSEQLNHAFEPKALDHFKTKRKKNAVCFSGSTISGVNWHSERISYLKALSSEVDIDIYTEATTSSYFSRLKRSLILKRHYLSKELTKLLPENKYLLKYSDNTILPNYGNNHESLFKKNKYDSLYGKEMLQKISEYSINFNQHIKVTGDSSCNLRLFEATGAGTCLLSDRKKNSEKLFIEDKEMVYYNSIEEAVEKAKFLLNNTNKANEIAKAGKSRTLKDYNTEKQILSLINYIEDLY